MSTKCILLLILANTVFFSFEAVKTVVDNCVTSFTFSENGKNPCFL